MDSTRDITFSCPGTLYALMGQGDSRIKNEITVLVLGLDGAGKSCIVEKLAKPTKGNIVQHRATNYQVTEFAQGKRTAALWDLNGGKEERNLWRHYYLGTKGLIFVVDGTQRDRFKEAKLALDSVIEDEELQGIPCLIFCCKSDSSDFVDITEIKNIFSFEGNPNIHPFPLHFEACSTFTGDGLAEGWKWIVDEVTKTTK
ncbi:putative ADP-ribosylation factor K [Blattamonas nauphoetae]|uniref:ADP-ribosylation factor K n=1 Tax=Blattamonas nauphoetae TaxID=2049346 RepID=A0ABQ9XKY3_9EUKA|nr:putative ADP-ribosylation factor K [Blattamonas nauphoetae]